ncbi:MAG: helix-hairpin-helix domain-containing protein, partial [bacterium]
ERIDIVPYHPDPEMFATRALSPAKVVRIETSPEDNSMTMVVEDDQLSLAIGKGGQNARLAAKLTGWKINITSEGDFFERKREEAESKVAISKLPHVGEATIQKLIAANYQFIQDILEVPPSRLTEVEGVGPKTADKIIDSAREYMFELEQRRAAEAAVAPPGQSAKKEITGASSLFHDDFDDDDDDDDESDAADAEDEKQDSESAEMAEEEPNKD